MLRKRSYHGNYKVQVWGCVPGWWRNRIGDHFLLTNSSKDHLNMKQLPQNH